MDIVTLNKIITNFDSHLTSLIDDSFLESEIDDLINLNIVTELSDGRFLLNRNVLYQYAKTASREGNYNLAIAIYKYLLEFKDKEAKNWIYTLNYQLFKNYFYKGDYRQSYQAFKQGYDKGCSLYPLILNMFDYLLQQKHEQFLTNEQLKNLFANKRFNDVKKYFEGNSWKANESQKKTFIVVNSKAVEVEQKIDNDVLKLIKAKDLLGLSDYIRKISVNHQSNESLRLIGFISDVLLATV